MKDYSALAAALVMGASTYLAVPREFDTVGAEEAASVWGAQNCVDQGSLVMLCSVNQTCNPNTMPPATGATSYYSNGTSTAQCYRPGEGYLYCPCGTSPYYIYGTNSASCYTGS